MLKRLRRISRRIGGWVAKKTKPQAGKKVSKKSAEKSPKKKAVKASRATSSKSPSRGSSASTTKKSAASKKAVSKKPVGSARSAPAKKETAKAKGKKSTGELLEGKAQKQTEVPSDAKGPSGRAAAKQGQAAAKSKQSDKSHSSESTAVAEEAPSVESADEGGYDDSDDVVMTATAEAPSALLQAMRPTQPADRPERRRKRDDLKIDRNGDIPAQWNQLKEKYKALKPLPYKLTDSFEARTPILHKTLGWGFIISNLNNRLEVIFENEIKMLISNYKP